MDYSKIDQVVKQGHADPSKHSLIIPSFLPPVLSVTSIDLVSLLLLHVLLRDRRHFKMTRLFNIVALTDVLIETRRPFSLEVDSQSRDESRCITIMSIIPVTPNVQSTIILLPADLINPLLSSAESVKDRISLDKAHTKRYCCC